MEDRDFIDFKFGDYWASEFNLVAVSSGDRYSPPVYGSVNPNTTTVAGKVGVYKWKSQIGEKVFNINIAFDNINGQTLNQIKEWLHPFKIDKLTFKEEPFKYYWVTLNSEPELNFVPFLEETKVVNGIEFKQGIYKGEFNIQFVCFDNYGYSDWQSFDENYDYLAEVVNSTNGVISVNDAMNVETEIGIQGISRQETRAAEEGKTVEGEMISLNDVDTTKEHEFIIEGNSNQETRSGKNLYNFKDAAWVSSEYIVDEDGWITISYDNTEGTAIKYFNYYTNNLNLKTNSTYGVFFEIKEIVGEGSFYAFSSYGLEGQSTSSSLYNFTGLSNGAKKRATLTTKEDFTNVEYGLRTYVAYAIGQSGSITFRISVLEDTAITTDTFVYEPYGKMPSFDYLSKIKSTGSNINLFNWETILLNKTINNQGIVSNSNYNFVSDYIEIEPNTVYRVNKAISCVFEFDKDFNIIGELRNSSTAGNVTTSANAKYLRVRNYYSTGDLTELAKTAKLEKGSRETSYSPFNQGSARTIVCKKNLLNPIGQSRANDGIVFTNNGDGTFTVKGTNTSNYSISFSLTDLSEYPIHLEKGKSYTQSFIVVSGTIGNFKVVPSVIDNDGNITYNYFTNNQTKIVDKDYRINAYNFYIPLVDTPETIDITFKVQLEEGNSATSYESHQSQSYPIYLDRELYGNETIKDSIIKRANKWYYKINWCKYIFTGNENFVNTYGTNLFNVGGLFNNKPFKVGCKAYSNYFTYNPVQSNINNTLVNYEFALQNYDTEYHIFLKCENYSSPDNFKAKIIELYANEKPLYIIYPLNEPFYEEITDETVIAQLDALENSTLYQGTTHISSEDNINLHYNYLTAIPSIKFPSEIQNTEEKVDIQICGKNLFNLEKLQKENSGITVTGTEENFSFSSKGIMCYYNYNFQENCRYTFSGLWSTTYGDGSVDILYTDKSTTAVFGKWDGKSYGDTEFKIVSDANKTIETVRFRTYSKGEFTAKNFQIELGIQETEYEPHQSQTITFPLAEGQKLYKGSYLAEDGIHNTRGQYIFTDNESIGLRNNGDESTTMSFNIFNIPNINYASRDILCNYFTNEWISTNGIEGVTGDSGGNRLYVEILRNRLSTEDIAGFKTFLANLYTSGAPMMIEYDLKQEEVIPYTQEQQEALNNIYLYTGTNNIFVDNAELSLTYVPQQNIYIDYMVNCSNLLNDSSFYLDNDIYKKSYFDLDTGDATNSGISNSRPVYLYNAGTTRANLNLTFDLIIPAEDSPLIIKTESCKLVDNEVQVLNEESLISISNFSNFKPFLEIYDGNLDNWQIEIDSELCEVYVKHKTDKTKIISLNKFNDEQSFLSLANCKFVDYLKPFPTSITAISNSAIENTIFNKLSVASSAQDYRLKNVNVEWKHTYL